MSVRMDWFEGFHVYGERGSVIARSFQPWYMRTSEVECFSESDGVYRRPLGADGHFWRRQVEGFADTVLAGAPQRGADARDGLAVVQHSSRSSARWTPARRSSSRGSSEPCDGRRIFAKTFIRPDLPETLDAVVAAGLTTIQFNMA